MIGTIIMVSIAVALLGSLAMAKARRRRRMGRYIRGNVDEELALTTLASKDVVGSVFDDVVNERTLVSSIVATWSLSTWTPLNGAGPIAFGVAHGDYTDAEIEEWLEQVGGWNEGNMVAREVGARKIRQIGTLVNNSAASTISLNDGKPVKTKLNWILNQGQTLRFWAYNQGLVAVSGTTVPLITAQGHVNLFPK